MDASRMTTYVRRIGERGKGDVKCVRILVSAYSSQCVRILVSLRTYRCPSVLKRTVGGVPPCLCGHAQACSVSIAQQQTKQHINGQRKRSDSTHSLQKRTTLNVELTMHGHEHDNVILVSMHVQIT